MKFSTHKLASIGFVFFMVIGSVLWFGTNDSVGQQDKKAQPTLVEATPLSIETLEQYLELTANVKSDSSVILKSEVAGRIASINFREGDRVSKGQVLITLNSESENATLAQEKANLTLKQSTLNRVSQLHQEGIISSQKLDEAQADLALAKANVAFAQAELNKKNIRAPFSGVIGIRSVNVGDLVQSGTELVTINDNEKLRIIFEIPASINSLIAKDSMVKIITPDQKELSMPVNFIEQSVNQTTRTLSAQIIIDQAKEDENLNLVSGQFIKVKVPTQKIENGNAIPEQALLPRGTKTFVYVIRNGSLDNDKLAQKAMLTPVNILIRTEGMVAIEGDIKQGDLIVTAGQQKLRGENANVFVKKARVIPMIPSAIEELPRAAK